MFDAILKILSSKPAILDSFHVTKEEFYFIKEFFDDAVHLIYAQEKNQVKEGDLQKNTTWQAVYAFAKEWLIRCNQMMHVSEQRTYEHNQVESRPVFLVDSHMTDALIRLSNRLNSVYGLADGEQMSNILQALREREQELSKHVAQNESKATPPPQQDFYQVEQ